MADTVVSNTTDLKNRGGSSPSAPTTQAELIETLYHLAEVSIEKMQRTSPRVTDHELGRMQGCVETCKLLLNMLGEKQHVTGATSEGFKAFVDKVF